MNDIWFDKRSKTGFSELEILFIAGEFESLKPSRFGKAGKRA
jgi:hypothetical protein